jgi:hypothetical protein
MSDRFGIDDPDDWYNRWQSLHNSASFAGHLAELILATLHDPMVLRTDPPTPPDRRGRWAVAWLRLMGAMRRTIVLAAVLLGLMLAACHPGSGWGERVDVPLTVSIEMAGSQEPTCGRYVCHIDYRVVITDEGDRAVFARDCWVRGFDQYHHKVFESIFGSGIGPGESTEPGKPFRARRTFSATVTPEDLATVRSLEGSCLAYIWHGTIPI